jgi:hypothetical protein
VSSLLEYLKSHRVFGLVIRGMKRESVNEDGEKGRGRACILLGHVGEAVLQSLESNHRSSRMKTGPPGAMGYFRVRVLHSHIKGDDRQRSHFA